MWSSIVGIYLLLGIVWGTTACAHTKPMPVVIVSPLRVKLESDKPTCYLEPMPEEPSPATIPYADDFDMNTRIWVHVLKYNEMVQYAHDIKIWGQSVNECIGQLTAVP